MRRVMYLCAVLMILTPFIQTFIQIWPIQIGSIQWRIASANVLSAVLLLPFLGLSLFLFMSRMLASRTLSMTVGVISAIFTLGLIGSLALFVLDGLQFKAIVNSQQMPAFMQVFTRVIISTVLFSIVYAVLAVAGLRAPKRAVVAAKKGSPKQADEGVGLIVGR